MGKLEGAVALDCDDEGALHLRLVGAGHDDVSVLSYGRLALAAQSGLHDDLLDGQEVGLVDHHVLVIAELALGALQQIQTDHAVDGVRVELLPVLLGDGQGDLDFDWLVSQLVLFEGQLVLGVEGPGSLNYNLIYLRCLLLELVKVAAPGRDVLLPLADDHLVAGVVQSGQADGVVAVDGEPVTEVPVLAVGGGHDDEGALSGVPFEEVRRDVLAKVYGLFELLVGLDYEFAL